MKNEKKRRRIDKLNVKQKKKKKRIEKGGKKMSLHSEHCRNEETFFISVKPETLHTDFLLFFSLFYPSAIFVDLFFLSRFFFFLFNLSRLRKRSIDVTTSPRIVTFQSVLFVLNWSIALTTPSFHASLFSFFSLLSLNYLILLDSERTILSLAKLFFFFFYLSTFAPIQRNVITFYAKRKRSQSMIWSYIGRRIKKLFNQSRGSLGKVGTYRIAADRAYSLEKVRAINEITRDNERKVLRSTCRSMPRARFVSSFLPLLN